MTLQELSNKYQESNTALSFVDWAVGHLGDYMPRIAETVTQNICIWVYCSENESNFHCVFVMGSKHYDYKFFDNATELIIKLSFELSKVLNNN